MSGFQWVLNLTPGNMTSKIHLNEVYQALWNKDKAEKLRYEYDLNENSYVIDIGSYRREWANEIEKRYGCRVECFEALDNRAAWKFDGELEFGGAFYYSSQLETEKPNRYKCFNIARWIDRRVDLLKMNIEGAEYELLDYLIDNGLIERIENLQVQFHVIEGMDTEKMYSKLNERLSESHFISWRYPFVWENWVKI